MTKQTQSLDKKLEDMDAATSKRLKDHVDYSNERMQTLEDIMDVTNEENNTKFEGVTKQLIGIQESLGQEIHQAANNAFGKLMDSQPTGTKRVISQEAKPRSKERKTKANPTDGTAMSDGDL